MGSEPPEQRIRQLRDAIRHHEEQYYIHNSPEIADEAHNIIRAQIAKSLSPALAASTRILYGGSVKPDNTASLCACADIDGALVGGASLDPVSFARIVAHSAA